MSIKKVANIAGVSIATVSRYFNNPDKVSRRTQEKVQNAIDAINYSPNALAQNLRRGKTGLIIVVVSKISSSLYEPIIRQLNKLAREHSYNLLVKESDFNSLPLGYFENMIRCKQSDGFIILTGLQPQSYQLPKELLPIVLACEPSLRPDCNLPRLTINYAEAAKDATRYLIKNKHQHIAFIAQNYSSTSTLEQQRGYLEAMQEAGLQSLGRIIDMENQQLSLQKKLNLLLETNPRLTAICCADDETAIETMHWLKARGFKIPENISVIGFHNTYFSKLCDPPLTTINNPMEEMGEQAIKLLFSIINSEPLEKSPNTFNHNIVIRHSTRPLG